MYGEGTMLASYTTAVALQKLLDFSGACFPPLQKCPHASVTLGTRTEDQVHIVWHLYVVAAFQAPQCALRLVIPY